MKPIDLKALHNLISPAIQAQGYELVDLDWLKEQGGWVLRIFIDRLPGQGYVSHQDCANVSHEISALLDVHDVLPSAYNLEVSSPGVNRPLKRPEDFARFVGKSAKVRLRGAAARPPTVSEGVGPRRNFVGKIAAVHGNVVRLSLQETNAQEVELAVDEIEKANLVYEP